MNKQMTKRLAAALVLTMAMAPSAAMAEIAAAKAGSFPDLGGIAQAKQDEILEASQLGLLEGDSTGRFRPTETLTRQEFAVLLAKALKLPLPDSRTSTYTDVRPTSWSCSSIEAVKQAGLMLGDGLTFHPYQPLTREEMATAFSRAVQAVGSRGGLNTKAVDQNLVSTWAQNTVDAAIRLGLIDTPGDTLNPQGNVQRQDIAGFLLDIFQVGERTATITMIEGNVVTIDGKPYLVDEKLNKLLGDRNQEALAGAVLKYKSSNRKVRELSELEITQNGVTLNTSGTTFEGSLRIAADGVAVKGDSLHQVILRKGASRVTLDAAVMQVVLDTDQKVALHGNAKLGQLQVANPKGQVTVGDGVTIDLIQLPDDVKLSDVILNLEQVKDKIKVVKGGIDDRSVHVQQSEPKPTPQPDNHKPSVVNQPPDLTKAVTDGNIAMSVANVFADADGDELIYTAASSSPSVATVAVNGSQLMITPVGVGTTTITVTANDGRGGTVQTEFNVTLEAAAPVNHPPTVAQMIQPLTAKVADGPMTVNLASVFADADNDTLSYSSVSSKEGVATVAVNGSQLMITPVGIGTTKIVITANDGRGGNVQTEFNVTLEAAAPVNHPPTVAQIIQPLTAKVADGPMTVNLASVFADADNDTLSYSSVSSKEGVATVVVNGSQLMITPVGVGTTTITVTANDGRGGTVQTEFNVNLEAAVSPKGLFFSELVWGSNDAFLQAIELYNPTDQGLDASKIRIECSNGIPSISLANGMISSSGTFTIVESFYFGGDVPANYFSMMGFYNYGSEPIKLSLYYDNQLMDIALFIPYKSMGRVTGTVSGNTTAYDSSQWKDEGVDYIDDLGKYTP